MSKPKTLGELQAPYELTYASKTRGSWQNEARGLERIVEFFGKDRAVDSIFRSDIEAFVAWLFEFYGIVKPKSVDTVLLVGSRWYLWMEDHEHVEYSFNPFYRYRRKNLNIVPR